MKNCLNYPKMDKLLDIRWRNSEMALAWIIVYIVRKNRGKYIKKANIFVEKVGEEYTFQSFTWRIRLFVLHLRHWAFLFMSKDIDVCRRRISRVLTFQYTIHQSDSSMKKLQSASPCTDQLTQSFYIHLYWYKVIKFWYYSELLKKCMMKYNATCSVWRNF